MSSEAGYFLIALIYGVPWIIIAQITAEMIFVGLTNWQPHSDADREWFGRSTGWFTVAAIMWFAVTFLVLIAGTSSGDLVAEYDSAKIASALLAAARGCSARSEARAISHRRPKKKARKSGLADEDRCCRSLPSFSWSCWCSRSRR